MTIGTDGKETVVLRDGKTDEGTVVGFEGEELFPAAGIGGHDLPYPRCALDHLELEKTVVAIGKEEAVIVRLTRRGVAPDELYGENKSVFREFAGERERFGSVDSIGLAIHEHQAFVGKAEDIRRKDEIYPTRCRFQEGIESHGRFIELLRRGLEMETVLLDQFGSECDAEEAVRQTFLGYQLTEREKRKEAVCLGFGELTSPEIDIMYLFITHLHLDECAIQT